MTGQSDAELADSIFGDQADHGQDPGSEADPNPVDPVEPEPAEPVEPAEPDPAEPVEPGEPDPVEPGEPERLFAGKYKTVEDMENAYLESQKNFHADRQEKGALKREIEEIKTLLVAKPPEPQRQPSPQEQAQNTEILRQRLMYEPEKVIEEMAEERAKSIVDAKLKEVLDPVLPSIQNMARADQINKQVQQYWVDHPEHKEYADQMAEIIAQNPQLMRDPNWIGQTYLMAKIADLETRLNSPTKPAKKTVDPAQKKAAAVSASAGVKGSASGEKKSDEDLLKDKLFGSAQEGRAMFDD